ncbi:MAG: MinD/ParA family protein [Eubacteriales bacterium]|nr:MinD/ParA family protein [Eubacteriales bacterium]
MDQAKQLRDLMSSSNSINKNSLSARVITISSGKGGVGKTNFSINLAIYFASLKKRVVVIDADFGLANVEVLLGTRPEYNFYHIIKGEKSISEVMVDTKYGIKFISGGNGLRELSNINNTEIKYFIEQFDYLDKIFDIIIIDTGAGISRSVTNFIMASDESIIVTTPEPTAFTDAYTLIKIIKEQNKDINKLKLVVNKADDKNEADRLFNKMANVTSKFLGIELENIGYIPSDLDLIKAVKQQKPAVLFYPESQFAKSVKNIGNNILKQKNDDNNKDGVKGFMKKLINIFGK